MEVQLEAVDLGRECFARRQAGAKVMKDVEGLGGFVGRQERRSSGLSHEHGGCLVVEHRRRIVQLRLIVLHGAHTKLGRDRGLARLRIG